MDVARLKKSSSQTINMLNKKDIYFQENDFTLLNGDSFKLLKKIESKSVDMIFADPPYFLSGSGISCHSGKQVSVNKGAWDIPRTPEEKLQPSARTSEERRAPSQKKLSSSVSTTNGSLRGITKVLSSRYRELWASKRGALF